MTGGGSPAPVHVGFDIGGTNVRGVPLRADESVGDTVKMRRPEDPEALVETVATLVAQIAAGGTEELDAALDVIGRTEGVRAMETLVQLSTKVDRRG